MMSDISSTLQVSYTDLFPVEPYEAGAGAGAGASAGAGDIQRELVLDGVLRVSFYPSSSGTWRNPDSDAYRRAVIKQLGAVPALEQEGLALRDVRQLRPQPVDLYGRHEGRQAAELAEDAVEVLLVAVRDILSFSLSTGTWCVKTSQRSGPVEFAYLSDRF